MEELCFVCSKSLLEGTTVVVERCLKTLRDASVERNYEKIEHLRNVNSIKIHVHCRKDYTRSSSISAFKRERDEDASTSTSSPPRRKTRLIAQPSFNFKERCMFCDEETCEREVKNLKKDVGKLTMF